MSRETERCLGAWGEALAARWLYRQGFTLLAHGFRCREGEIDLIARRDDLLAVVEVKLRSGRWEVGAAAVTERKQRRIRTALGRYLLAHPELSDCRIRFDVCQITAPDGTGTPRPELDYLENAFY